MRTSIYVTALISLALVSCEKREDRPTAPKTDYQQAALLSTGDEYQTEEDRLIIQKIRQSLYNDSSLNNPNRKIMIISNDGDITLKGLVDTAQEKNIIENRIRYINGVRQIYNQLEINGRDATLAENLLDVDLDEPEVVEPNELNDNALIQRIKDSLQRDPSVARPALSLNVQSYDGEVTLRGMVDTEQARNNIVNKVKQIPGVNSVQNQIQVRSDLTATNNKQNNSYTRQSNENNNNTSQFSKDPDEELEQRIHIVLRNDPNLSAPAQRINIEVNDGVVTISGFTNNEQERIAIGNRIRQLSGVNKVNNQIRSR